MRRRCPERCRGSGGARPARARHLAGSGRRARAHPADGRRRAPTPCFVPAPKLAPVAPPRRCSRRRSRARPGGRRCWTRSLRPPGRRRQGPRHARPHRSRPRRSGPPGLGGRDRDRVARGARRDRDTGAPTAARRSRRAVPTPRSRGGHPRQPPAGAGPPRAASARPRRGGPGSPAGAARSGFEPRAGCSGASGARRRASARQSQRPARA